MSLSEHEENQFRILTEGLAPIYSSREKKKMTKLETVSGMGYVPLPRLRLSTGVIRIFTFVLLLVSVVSSVNGHFITGLAFAMTGIILCIVVKRRMDRESLADFRKTETIE